MVYMYVRMSACVCVTDRPTLGESCCLSEDTRLIACTVVVLSRLLSGTSASKTVLTVGVKGIVYMIVY